MDVVWAIIWAHKEVSRWEGLIYRRVPWYIEGYPGGCNLGDVTWAMVWVHI